MYKYIHIYTYIYTYMLYLHICPEFIPDILDWDHCFKLNLLLIPCTFLLALII